MKKIIEVEEILEHTQVGGAHHFQTRLKGGKIQRLSKRFLQTNCRELLVSFCADNGIDTNILGNKTTEMEVQMRISLVKIYQNNLKAVIKMNRLRRKNKAFNIILVS